MSRILLNSSIIRKKGLYYLAKAYIKKIDKHNRDEKSNEENENQV